MRKVKESKKDKNLKQKRIIKEKQKEKQKQKQHISIVINSNNKSKRTGSAPKQQPQPQPQPQQSRISNNPPVVNVMGDTRPQVTASGNYSGIGQQNRIFATDSELEQRLARLEKWENDSSSNPSPMKSNENILKPNIKKEIIKAPDYYRREEYNFFKPQEEKEQNRDDIDEGDGIINEEDENNSLMTNDTDVTHAQVIEDNEEFQIIPRKKSVSKRLAEYFSPKSNAQIQPQNIAPLSAVQLANHNAAADHIELQKPWYKMGRDEKRTWAVTNMPNRAGGVYETEERINNMKVKELDALRTHILSERRV